VSDPIHTTLANIRLWIDTNIRDPFNKAMTDIKLWIKTYIEDPFNSLKDSFLTFFKFDWIPDPFKPIRDWLKGLFSLDWLPQWVKDLVIPKGASTTTNTNYQTLQTINVSGLSVDQLNGYIDARLRQQGSRYMA